MRMPILVLMLVLSAGCCVQRHEPALIPADHGQILAALVQDHYPGLTLGDESLLEEDVRKYVRKHYPESALGYACGHFRDDSQLDCALLLQDKQGEIGMSASLVLALNAFSPNPWLIELMPLSRYPTPNAFLRPLPGQIIHDASTLNNVTMPREGFEIIFLERSSIAYFFAGQRLMEVYTSD